MSKKESRTYAQIRVKRETQQVLKRLSDFSGLDYIDILAEWTKAIQSTLDKFETYDKLSVFSHSYEKSTEHEGLVLTRLAKLTSGKFQIKEGVQE